MEEFTYQSWLNVFVKHMNRYCRMTNDENIFIYTYHYKPLIFYSGIICNGEIVVTLLST